MQNIGVFLSSRSDVPVTYRRATEEVGRWIGETCRTLVYGGSGVGLMAVLADQVKASGGRIVGVVPQFVVDRNMVSDKLDVEIRTAGLADRKTVMMERSDILVALPGGVGTLDEVFTTLAGRLVGEHSKRVVLYDVDGCWSLLNKMLDRLVENGLYGAVQREGLTVISSVEELESICRE